MNATQAKDILTGVIVTTVYVYLVYEGNRNYRQAPACAVLLDIEGRRKDKWAS
ncbi:MAG: hypothetical protein MRJ65_07315 [Candidatus Brocadiaceae bacterium]|nr:hypothetical protein [Candidatus Brocadiaceae bacterium]